MYTKEQDTLRTAFVNYFGVAVDCSPYEGGQAKQNAIALFAEELVKQGQNEDKTIDIQSLKPLLNATLWILKKRREEMIDTFVKSFGDFPDDTFTKELDTLIEGLNDYINKI